MRYAYALLFFLLSFMAAGAQPVELTIAKERLASEGLKAVMVSNQYGVLRYFAFAKSLERDSNFTFSVRRRIGEQLALTFVNEVEDGGYYSFRNTTYANLQDGAVIGQPSPFMTDATTYRPVEVNIAGVEGVEEFTMFGPQGRRPEYRVNKGILRIRGFQADSTGLFMAMRFPGEQRFRHFVSNMTADNQFSLSTEGLGEAVLRGRMGLPAKAEWKGTIRGWKNGQPFYLYNSAQQSRGATDTVDYLLPGGVNFDSITYFLAGLEDAGMAFYGSAAANLPSHIDGFPFEPSFESVESKGFRFSTAAEKGGFFAISYYYSMGEGKPLPSWHIWGELPKEGDVDFILPDLPVELYEMLPELEEVARPIAVDKNSFRLSREPSGYQFGLAPAALEDLAFRLHNGLQARRSLKMLVEQ